MITVEKNVDGFYALCVANVMWVDTISHDELLTLRDSLNYHITNKLNEDLLALMDGADDCEGGACKI